MVYNTTQHPPNPLPHTQTLSYILYVYFGKWGRGGGGQIEGRGAPVHREVENTNMTDCISSQWTLLSTSKDDI
jgi:hypothetical protein